MKVLLLEDVKLIQKMIKNFLSDLAVVEMVENGTSALRLVKESIEKNEPYNAIFLDVLIPDMDGLQVLKEIRKTESENSITSEKRSKIIMVSTITDENTVKRAMTAGCDGYIAKPFSKDRLISELKSLKLI